jgi:WXG100 family type VII secretion target
MNIDMTAAEMTSAANKIEECIAQYEEASNAAKRAADDLTSKWKGDAREAFVLEQEQASAWYANMAQIVRTYVDALRKYAESLQNADATSAQNIKSR